MYKTMSWVGLFIALALVSGCKKKEGDACFDRKDCAEGLVCSGEALMRCQKCEGLQECTVNGKCTAKDGVCVAASDEECKKSIDCKERGPCTAKDGVCVVGSDADCKQSVACAKDKFCVAKGNNCIMSEADKKAAEKARAEAAEAAQKAQEEKEAQAQKEAENE